MFREIFPDPTAPCAIVVLPSLSLDADVLAKIAGAGAKAGQALQRQGALGQLGVDFVSVRRGDVWKNHAFEINLRRAGRPTLS